jgi:hypothetical protein
MINRPFGFGLGKVTLCAGILMGDLDADTHETILLDRFGSVACGLRGEPYGDWREFCTFGIAPTLDGADMALCEA